MDAVVVEVVLARLQLVLVAMELMELVMVLEVVEVDQPLVLETEVMAAMAHPELWS
jgi:hypothetical protein